MCVDISGGPAIDEFVNEVKDSGVELTEVKANADLQAIAPHHSGFSIYDVQKSAGVSLKRLLG